MIVARLAFDSNAIWMGSNPLKTLPLIESDCALVFSVDRKFELLDATVFRLFDDTLHQNLGCPGTLIVFGNEERSNLSPVTRAFKSFPAKAAKSDELCLIEDASESAKVENFSATLSGSSDGLRLSNKKSQREVARSLYSKRLPSISVF